MGSVPFTRIPFTAIAEVEEVEEMVAVGVVVVTGSAIWFAVGLSSGGDGDRASLLSLEFIKLESCKSWRGTVALSQNEIRAGVGLVQGKLLAK